MLMFVLLCFTGTAYATDWTEWPAKTDVPIDKVWTITFNQPIESKTIHGSFNIVDANGNKVDVCEVHTGKNTVAIYVNPDYLYGTQYFLYINGVKSVDGKTVKPARMSFTTITPQQDTTPPAAPKGLITESGDKFFKVSWQANTESDLAGYHVYAGLNQSYFVMAKTNSGSDIFTSTYIQTNESDNDVTFYFYITAVDINGNESARSEIVSVTPKPAYQMKAPLKLFSDDDKNVYLGKLTSSKYDSESVFNEYGTYGSKYGSNSIWNEFGTYGSKFSVYSAFNDLTPKPPMIIDGNNNVVGRLTTNTFIAGGIDPNKIYDVLVKLGF